MNEIDYFRSIRDIPYYISTDIDEAEHSCYFKHLLLKNSLESLGINTRLRLCEFRWDNLPLPKGLKRIIHSEYAGHTYLETEIDKKWETLDLTWDKGIESILPVQDWDGLSSTNLAVLPTKVYSPEECLMRFSIKDTPEIIERDLKINREFYKALNGWMSNARKEFYSKK